MPNGDKGTCKDCEFWTEPKADDWFPILPGIEMCHTKKGFCCNFMSPRFDTEPEFSCDEYHIKVNVLVMGV